MSLQKAIDGLTLSMHHRDTLCLTFGWCGLHCRLFLQLFRRVAHGPVHEIVLLDRRYDFEPRESYETEFDTS